MSAPAEVTVRWLGDGLRFEGRSGENAVVLDGQGAAGPSPVSTLLLALAGCAGADVVEILGKGREEPDGVEIRVRGRRREEPPRHFTALHVEFVIRGPVDPAKAERAARLSFETYCSVFHTLRKDLELEWEVRLEDASG